ncbi:MAG: 1,4-alpha-glucan branching protein GlgB, partial [Oscillospiraceae bacterium]
MELIKEALSAFSAGHATRAQAVLGAHPATVKGESGYMFRCWAPNATAVSVMGDFNCWDDASNPMLPLENGIWEGFVPALHRYDNYKYAVHTPDGRVLAKADPYAFHAETRPGTASKIYDLEAYPWQDGPWMKYRAENPVYRRPLNVYEIHLGSWRRTENDEFLSYRAMAEQLPSYMKEMGYTHVELMPITEY